MSIIALVAPFTPGSKLAGEAQTGPEGERYSVLYATIHTHVGKCLSEREHNMRDDSDFYMTVWNDEKNAPESICFASTRGWSYPCMGSFVDATDEVKAKYESYKKQQARNNTAASIRRVRKQAENVANALRIDRKTALRLINGCKDQSWKLEAVTKLLTGALRSSMRISFREQVREWLKDPAHKHSSPLSRRQWSTMHPMRFATVYRNGYNANSIERMNRPASEYGTITELYKRSGGV